MTGSAKAAEWSIGALVHDLEVWMDTWPGLLKIAVILATYAVGAVLVIVLIGTAMSLLFMGFSGLMRLGDAIWKRTKKTFQSRSLWLRVLVYPVVWLLILPLFVIGGFGCAFLSRKDRAAEKVVPSIEQRAAPKKNPTRPLGGSYLLETCLLDDGNGEVDHITRKNVRRWRSMMFD